MKPWTLGLVVRAREAKPEAKLHCTKASSTAPQLLILFVIHSNSCACFSAATSSTLSPPSPCCLCFFCKLQSPVIPEGKIRPSPLNRTGARYQPSGIEPMSRVVHEPESSIFWPLWSERYRRPNVRANAEDRAARLI